MGGNTGGRAAVFVDRDNTLMADVPYCRRREDVRLLSGVGTAIRRLNDRGLLVLMVTNQSGIGRGLFTQSELDAVHDELARQLSLSGAHLDGIYACPHHPDEGCPCRKPGVLLFERACEERGIDPAASFVVGDRGADVEAGRRIGARTALVRNPVGLAELARAVRPPDVIVESLEGFVEWLESGTRPEELKGDHHLPRARGRGR